jgi:hypothetical protein
LTWGSSLFSSLSWSLELGGWVRENSEVKKREKGIFILFYLKKLEKKNKL